MKKILLLLLIPFIVNCGSSKIETKKTTKVKTFKGENIIVRYPKTWIQFGGVGHIYFIPKEIRESTFENEIEHVSVNKNDIHINDFNQIEKELNKHGKTLTRNQLKKSFELIKLNTESKFIYKIESLITYNFDSKVYKRIEYFYKYKGKLNYYYYQMRQGLFDLYHDEGLFIISSINNN